RCVAAAVVLACVGCGSINDGGNNDAGAVEDGAPPPADGGGTDVGSGDDGGCRTGAVDVPDLAFTDSDCDGIDGTAARAIFVSPRGQHSDRGPWPPPRQPLPAALAAAAAAAPRRDVYAALGVYQETVTLASGVSIYGGYQDFAGWQRVGGAGASTTTIDSPT